MAVCDICWKLCDTIRFILCFTFHWRVSFNSPNWSQCCAYRISTILLRWFVSIINSEFMFSTSSNESRMSRNITQYHSSFLFNYTKLREKKLTYSPIRSLFSFSISQNLKHFAIVFFSWVLRFVIVTRCAEPVILY